MARHLMTVLHVASHSCCQYEELEITGRNLVAGNSVVDSYSCWLLGQRVS